MSSPAQPAPGSGANQTKGGKEGAGRRGFSVTKSGISLQLETIRRLRKALSFPESYMVVYVPEYGICLCR